MRWLLPLVLISLCTSPALAFVGRLDPTTAVRVPCHQFRGAVVEFAHGTFTAAQLGDWLEATFLLPYGVAWSAEDATDNSNLIAHLNGLSQADAVLLGLRIEGLCAAWEADPTLWTRNQIRTLIGIALQ